MTRSWFFSPAVSTLDLECTDFDLPGDPDVPVVTYTAAPGSPSADGLILPAAWAQTQKADADSPAALRDEAHDHVDHRR